jgi:single-strand DNA-binding protein
MNDTITVTGIVASPPRHLVSSAGVPITSFRLASRQRRFDRLSNSWVDGETNWYNITTYRHLAMNVAQSVRQGEHVVILGRLRIRKWENGERNGTAVDVDADSVGHDLLWCTATAARNIPPAKSAGRPDPDDPDSRTVAVLEEDPGTLGGDGFLPAEVVALAGI